MIILNLNLPPYETENNVTCIPWPTDSKVFQAVNRGQGLKSGIWNNPVGRVILSQCQRVALNSIYSQMEDYKTKIKTHLDTECDERKWWQPQF